MKTFATTLQIFILLLFFVIRIAAQDQRTFNQNSSRSNHSSSYATPGFNFSFSPVYSTSLNSKNDSLLFRGSGGGIKFGGDYFFGKAGIGLSSGFGSSSPDNNAINRFLQKANIPMDQLVITKSNQQNMYFLLGPSLRFGSTVELLLHAKGGLFINNGGLVMIQQKGAVRAAYRNESTTKSIYPGFQTGLNVQYSIKSDVWSFGIGADYMGTRTEINNYDARRGGIEGLKLSKNISDLVAGITIRYNIHSARDQATGHATGRVLPTVNKREIISPRDAQSGLPTGRVLPTVNKKEIAIDESGVHKIAIDESGVHRTISQSCGPVTLKTTNADGKVEEMTFSCPDDAAAYAEKINPGKQKNWLPSNFRTNSNEGKGSGIISGRLTWPLSNSLGIVTNKTRDTRGGSTTINSQTGNTRTTPNNSFGTMVRISAREAGSGMATGKRSREASSGMATGRLYETVFEEGQDEVCNPCIASVKSNPLYSGKMGAVQNNPLYQGNERTVGDGDCNDGIAGIDVSLVDLNSGAVVAKTKTESCGDFFFANVPGGNYIVKLSGIFAAKKGYDINLKSKTDLLGSIQQDEDAVQLMINTDGSDPDGNDIANAIIKTKTKSNQSNDRVAVGDVNGDGLAIWSPRSNAVLLRVASGDVNGDGIDELLIGNQVTDFGISRQGMKSFFEKGDMPAQSQRMPGDPIPGLDVKLGKNPGGQGLQTTTANGEGEFQFKGLDAGDYFITIEQNIVIDDETIVTVTGDAEKNINTSESNIGHDKAMRKGWDGTIRGNTKNINTSESNLKEMTLKDKDVKVSASQNSQTLKTQNNDTVRSNRTELKSILIEADLDGDGEYETDITNRLNDEITIDEGGQIVAPKMKAGVSTSRSNIRTRSSLQAKGDGIYVSLGRAMVNNKEVEVRSVLKTKHDTVKNSINNVR